MTDRNQRLAEIEAREAAATKGPWRHFPEELSCEGDVVIARCVGQDVMAELTEDDCTGFDAAFLANARQDIPWLLAEVKRLEAERDNLSLVIAGRLAANPHDWRFTVQDMIEVEQRGLAAGWWQGMEEAAGICGGMYYENSYIGELIGTALREAADSIRRRLEEGPKG